MMRVIFDECPACRNRGKDNHKDNLARYPDGHAYCFSCGYFEPGTSGWVPVEKTPKTVTNKLVELPSDAVSFIATVATKWLDKFHIYNEDIVKNGFQWSFTGTYIGTDRVAPLLIYPIYDIYGHLQMWQGRNFGVKDSPKYVTVGNKEEVLKFYGLEKDTVVLVEDVLSAIRVGKAMRAMPLFGKTISKERILKLSSKTKHLKIWLDPKAETDAVKLERELSPYFDSIHFVWSDLDPKCYSDPKIKEFLHV